MMFVKRKLRLCAAHRMFNPSLTDEENYKLYGAGSNEFGQGHNYTINIVLYGPVDPITGMVINLTDLKQVMIKAIEKPFDHKNIDKQIEYFQTHVSTVENIAIYIWQEMKKYLAKSELLYEVCVRETDMNVVRYRGE